MAEVRICTVGCLFGGKFHETLGFVAGAGDEIERLAGDGLQTVSRDEDLEALTVAIAVECGAASARERVRKVRERNEYGAQND